MYNNRIMKWKNLAPHITRQRVVIEGTTQELVGEEAIKDYLIKLAEVTKMEIISGPFSSTAHNLGYSGWIHWRTSGAHVYTYPEDPFNTGAKGYKPLITVDAYTCKSFDAELAAEFTRKYFNCVEMVYKEIEI